MPKIKNNHMIKNTVAGIFGNILEWYDFAVFGFLAPVMSTLFFPEDDPLAGLIKTFGVLLQAISCAPWGVFYSDT